MIFLERDKEERFSILEISNFSERKLTSEKNYYPLSNQT